MGAVREALPFSPIRARGRRVAGLASLAAALAIGCGGSSLRVGDGNHGRASGTPRAQDTSGSCPALAAAPDLPPGTSASHRALAYWVETLASQVALDEPLLDDASRTALDSRLAAESHAFDLAAPYDAAEMEARLAQRRRELHDAAAEHALFAADGAMLPADAFDAWEAGRVVDPTVHRARAGFSVRCSARRAPFHRSATDHRFDRNQCSFVEAGEPVQVLARLADGTLLLRTRYTFGYANDPPLDDALAASELAAIVGSARVRRTSFTRRAVLEEAFAHLGRAYGWGGEAGGLDCSAFVLDVLGAFGIRMPRHSGDQADAGTERIEVPADATPEARLAQLDAANQRGLVLVHFPGHVMLYLGRDREGTPMAIHAYAEYVEPCASPESGRTETVRTTHGVDVTTFELGRGTSRRSYLERMTSLTLFGRPVTSAANTPTSSAASHGKSASPLVCTTEDDATLHRSPRRPHAGGPLRMLWSSERDAGPVAITMVATDGRHVELAVEQVPGPPWGAIGRAARVDAGTWTIFVTSGSAVIACEAITVEPVRQRAIRPVTSAPHAWNRAYEDLWSLFVRKLFDQPYDDRTWPNLQQVLDDSEHNVLFDHFTAEEESRLRLEPDCADLPYVLRAYFAWKMGLPFAIRSCANGRDGAPPACGTPTSNVGWLLAEDRADDFQRFANTVVRQTAQSASGRTPPRTDASDFYPIALDRESMRPGTVYADPYGHVMMITRFIPAGPNGYGMLTAADAQPDGTIGRPRFWRGTFLFTPDTSHAGAGFKAFRPVVRRGPSDVRQASNASLRASTEFARYSTSQYEGSADDFYDRVESLIDPQPVNAEARLVALVDALFDSVRRRTVSVDNAEQWVAAHPRQTIPMPTGAEIFQTAGAWEDFSTPSRDLRLLIALDTVVSFPAAVERRPDRFGLAAGDLTASLTALRSRLERELHARSFTYRDSSGAPVTLSLADIRARARALEVAYDPNDCPEVRWGAPPGSAELAGCRRRAPDAQRRRLEQYRVWFAERRRPPP